MADTTADSTSPDSKVQPTPEAAVNKPSSTNPKGDHPDKPTPPRTATQVKADEETERALRREGASTSQEGAARPDSQSVTTEDKYGATPAPVIVKEKQIPGVPGGPLGPVPSGPTKKDDPDAGK